MADRSDYKCTHCNHIMEYTKERGIDFPQYTPCEKCGKLSKRKIQVGGICIPEHMKSSQGFQH